MRLALSLLGVVATVLLSAAMLFTAGWVAPPIETQQIGFRGVGMEQNRVPRQVAALQARNVAPPADDPAPPGGVRANAEYKNVQVLGDLTVDEFNRVMLAITNWVSPEQGCAYCHNVENLAEDSVYTKIVSRRMFQMVGRINNDWKAHVAATGVTCYTCHRGQPVPPYTWFKSPGMAQAGGFAARRDGHNLANEPAGLSSLPSDAITDLLAATNPIRVIPTTALPQGTSRATTQDTERTYSLMMQMSQGLGVNCTFCHNSRSFSAWDSSPPARGVAWHGIQMVRELNVTYLDPLQPTYPRERLGPTGDAGKANCSTCHQGAAKPLLGAQMMNAYPELNRVTP